MTDTEKTTKEWDGPGLIPPEGHKDVGKKIFELVAKIIAYKAQMGLYQRWNRNYELRKNKHWRQDKNTTQVPLVSANLIFTHIERTVNVLCDNNPTFNIAKIEGGPDSQQDPQVYEDLQHTAEHWWIDQEQQDAFESSVLDGETYGVCIEKVVFNDELELNLGEVETVNIDPFHFGFWPIKGIKNPKHLQKCEAVFHFYPESVRKLKEKYPQFKDEIKPDEDLIKEIGDDRDELAKNSAGSQGGNVLLSFQNAVRTITNYFWGSSSEEDAEEETLLCECYYRDKTAEGEGENSQPKYTGEMRYILICTGGKVVLEDRDNPSINPNMDPDQAKNCYLYDKFPFIMANSIKDTSNPWGMSSVEQVEWLVMEMNKALSQFVYEKDRTTRTKIINPKDSGVPNDDLTNIFGILNPSNSQVAQGLKFLEPPKSSIDYDKAIGLFKDLVFLVAGTFELDQAQVQGREVIAYKAIAALMERAATMMRGKIRSYGRLCREKGRMYLSNVMNFYTEPRWITYTDTNGEESSKQINGSQLVVPIKLTVVSGSTLPISKVAKREEALALFTQGAIDAQELLTQLEYSNRNEVIQRVAMGPAGMLIQRLAAIGMPQELSQLFSQIGQMKDSDFKQAVKQGQIPAFMQVVAQLLGQQQDEEQPPSVEEQELEMDIYKTKAEIQKTQAEVALIQEKTVSERVKQEVDFAGIAFDKEELKNRRAELVTEMEAHAAEREEKAKDREVAVKGKVADHMTQLEISKDRNKAGKPGYNEKGMKSNNKK